MFQIIVRVSSNDLNFILPTQSSFEQLSYHWIIDWGDSVIEERHAKDDLLGGVLHTYPSSGEYTITIKPIVENQLGWLRRFGFSGDDNIEVNKQSNKNKVISVITPLTQEMICYKSTENDICSYMFYGCQELTMGSDFNLPDFMDEVIGTNAFSNMFANCTKLEMNRIFNFPKGIKTVGNNFAVNMFHNCTSLTMNNNPLTPMDNMFNLPQTITEVGDDFCLSMFENCSSLTMNDEFNLPVSIETVGVNFCKGMFINSNVNMNDVFNLPQNIQSVGDGFCQYMFYNCINLENNNVFTFPNTINKIGKLFGAYMFYDCGNFQMNNVKLPVINTYDDYFLQFCFSKTNADNVNNFFGNKVVASVDLNKKQMFFRTFANSRLSVAVIDLPIFDNNDELSSGNQCFDGATPSMTIVVPNNWKDGIPKILANGTYTNDVVYDLVFSNEAEYNEWVGLNKTIIKTITLSAPINSFATYKDMFKDWESVQRIDINGLSTIGLTDVSGMFQNCPVLHTIAGLDKMVVNDITTMANMFNGCTNLNLTHLQTLINTSKLTDVSGMFNGVQATPIFNLTSMNASKITNMANMFSNVNTSEILLPLNISVVENVSEMFKGLVITNDIDFSAMTTENVLTFASMFENATLKKMNISTFNINNSNTTEGMFANMSSLQEIIMMNDVFQDIKIEIDIPNNPTIIYVPFVLYDDYTTDTKWLPYEPQIFPYDVITISGTTTSDVPYITQVYSENDLKEYIQTNKETIKTATIIDHPELLVDFSNLFKDCINLESYNLDETNIGFALNFNSMFENCTSLEYDVQFPKIMNENANMENMFRGCSNLVDLHINNAKITEYTNVTNMFDSCPKLKFIVCDDEMYIIKDTANLPNNPTYIMVSGANWQSYMDDLLMGYKDQIVPVDMILVNGLTSDGDRIRQIFDNDTGAKNLISSNILTSVLYTDMNGIGTQADNLFKNQEQLTTINIELFNTFNVTTMESMFDGCSALTSFLGEGIYAFDLSKVTTTANMFRNCSSLETLMDNYFWTAPNNTNMINMFKGCSSLTSLYMRNFVQSNIINLSGVFAGCSSLTTINVENWDTSNVTIMSETFMGCSSLTTITGFTTWDTTNVQMVLNMFQDCSSLPSLDLNSFDTDNVSIMSGMFNGCSLLTIISGIEIFNTDNVTDMNSMFSGCSSLTELDLTNWNTSNVTNFSYMFNGCSELISLIIPFNTNKGLNFEHMFNGCSALTNLNLSAWLTPVAENISYMFANCSSLTEIDLSTWETLTLNNLNNAFENMPAVVNAWAKNMIDADKLNASSNKSPNVNFLAKNYEPEMDWFYNYTNVDLQLTTGFTTALVNKEDYYVDGYLAHTYGDPLPNPHRPDKNINYTVTSLKNTFYNTAIGGSLDLSLWDTSQVTTFYLLFSLSNNLTSINVSGWNTSNVTNMYGVFDVNNLEEVIGMENWDVTSVGAINDFLLGATKMTTIDLSGWDTSSFTDTRNMFNNCIGVTTAWGRTQEDCDRLNATTNKAPNVVFTVKKFNRLSGTMEDGTEFTELFLTEEEMKSYLQTNKETIITLKAESDEGFLTSLNGMFDGLSKMTTIDLSVLTITGITDATNMMNDCSSVTHLDFSMLDFSEITLSDNMFQNMPSVIEAWGGSTADCTKLNATVGKSENVIFKFKVTIARVYGLYTDDTEYDRTFDTESEMRSWLMVSTQRNRIKTMAVETPIGFNTNGSELFYYYRYMTDLDVTYFDTSAITTMNEMFRNCSILTNIIGLEYFNTSNVTNMYQMFYGCPKLESLNLSSFDTSNVTTMYQMFRGCTSLTEINGLENWDTGKVSTMFEMFGSCTTLTTLNVSKFNTSRCIDTRYMFNSTSLLTELSFDVLDLSSLSNENNENMFHSGQTVTIGTFVTPVYASQVFSGAQMLNVTTWDTSNTTYMANMFYNYKTLTTLDVSGWDTSNVTDMYEMFYNCSNLTSITGLENWDISNVITMYEMFRDCSSLTSVNMNGLDTSNVISVYQMFYNCSKMTTLDVSGWNTSKVIDFRYMVSGCSSLTEIIGFEELTFDSCLYIDTMFQNCSSLTNINTINFNPIHATNISYMFSGCGSLNELDFRNWDTSNVTSKTSIFNSCSTDTPYIFVRTMSDKNNLTTNTTAIDSKLTIYSEIAVDYISTDTAYTTVYFNTFNDYQNWLNENKTLITDLRLREGYHSLINDYSNMFSGCTNLQVLDLSNSDFTDKNIDNIITGCNALTYLRGKDQANIDLLNNSIGKPISIDAIFEKSVRCILNDTPYEYDTLIEARTDMNSKRSTSVVMETSPFTTSDGQYIGTTYINTFDVSGFNTRYMTSFFQLFSYCESLTTITGLENWDTSSVTTMKYMFLDCYDLTSLDLSNFDTSKVTDMSYMFDNCYNLTSLDVSGWNTSNVIDMRYMFYHCYDLTSLDLSNFDTSKVIDTSYMFNNCSKMTTLDVSGWNTGNVTTMSRMFTTCKQLITITGLENWDTSSVTSISHMFNGCSSLTSIDVSGWNTGNVTTMEYMFSGCSNLVTVNGSENWDTTKLWNMSYMFNTCSSLIEFNITKPSPTHLVSIQGDKIFLDCKSLKSVDLSGIYRTTFNGDRYDHETFNGCNIIEYINMENMGTEGTSYGWNNARLYIDMIDSLTTIDNLRVIKVNSNRIENFGIIQKKHNICEVKYKLNNEEIRKVEFSTINDLKAFISNIKLTLTNIDLIFFKNQPDTDLSGLFDGCINLKHCGICLETTNTINLNRTFADCSSLISLCLTRVSITPTTDVTDMLLNCSAMIKPVYVIGEDVKTHIDTMSNKPETLIVSSDVGITVEYITTENTSTGTPSENISVSVDNIGELYDLSIPAIDSIKFTDRGRLIGFNVMKAKTPSNKDVVFDIDIGRYISFDNLFYDGATYKSLVIKNMEYNKIESYYNMFWGNDTLAIDVSTWNTSSATNMSCMFIYARGVSVLDVSGWDTSKVTNMKHLFTNCEELITLDVSGWDTSNVTDMYATFSNCSSLTTITGLENWDTSNVTTMEYMFYHNFSLSSFDVSNFDLSKVVNTGNMFAECYEITEINLSKTNIQNITYTGYMFNKCTKLTTIDMSGSNFNINVNGIYMFSGCTSLTIVYCIDQTTCDLIKAETNAAETILFIPRFFVTTTAVVDGYEFVNEYETFFECQSWISMNTNMTSISINVRNNEIFDISNLFENCSSLTTLDLSSFDFTKITNVDNIFLGCSSLTEVKCNSFIGRTLLSESIGKPDITTVSITGAVIYAEKVNSIGELQAFGEFKTLAEYKTFVNTSPTNVGIKFSSYGIDTLSYMLNYYSTSFEFVEVEPGSVVSLSAAFHGYRNLTSITGLENLDTSNVTTMYQMFRGCQALETLDVSGWDTSNVTTMEILFHDCTSLTTITGLENWDTSNVTNMKQIFQNCTFLTSLDLSGWDTSNIDSMVNMFYNCSKLTSLNVSSFDTSNVNNMYYMFYGCSKLTSLDVSNFDTQKVSDMVGMFSGCSSLTTLDLSNFNTSNVSEMNNMFYNCSKLTEINLSSFNTSNVQTMANMFYNCSSLTTLDLSNFNTSNVEEIKSMLYNVQNIIFNVLDLSSVSINDMGNIAGKNFTINHIICPSSMSNFFSGANSISVSTWDTSKTTILSSIFSSCSITSIDVSGWDTSNVTNMYGIFYNCNQLTTITGLENWDTSNVTNMSYMFFECNQLTTITGLENWNTGNVTSMNRMFTNCSMLTSLDNIQNWDTGNVTNMGVMFYGCSALTSLDLGSWNTPKVSEMSEMFRNASNIESITLNLTVDSRFNVSTTATSSFHDCVKLKTINMNCFNNTVAATYMFSGCTSLTDVNLMNIDLSAVTYMFSGCSSLTNLDTSTFKLTTTTITTMFNGCSSLITVSGLENWNYNRITSIDSLFSGCLSLVNVNTSKISSKLLRSINNTFYNCSSLTELDLSGLYTHSISTSNTFYNCNDIINAYTRSDYEADILNKSSGKPTTWDFVPKP